MSGGIIDVLHFALDGVTAQQNAIANNIANLDTPGYHDVNVSFQQSLADALGTPGASANITQAPSATPVATNGNNVNLATELSAANKSTLEYQVLSESIQKQFGLISGVVGGTFA